MFSKYLLKNYPAVFAVLIGILLLLISYGITDRDTISHHVTHELGFALIVAVVVWFVFEVGTRSETTRDWNDRIDRISRNVFLSVLGRNMSEDYKNELQLVALDKSFERYEFFITYHISDDTYVDRQKHIRNFVRLEAMTRIKMRNVSIKPEKYLIAVGLPNPIINELKQYCSITKASYRRTGEYFTEINLVKENNFLQEELLNDEKYQITVNCGEPVEIQPGEEIEIKQEFIMAKEEEDTEIVQTLYPTNSCIVTVVDSGPDRRIVRARAIHRRPIDGDLERADAGIYVFRIERPLLPYQGFAVFWKRRPTWVPPGKPTQISIDDPQIRGESS